MGAEIENPPDLLACCSSHWECQCDPFDFKVISKHNTLVQEKFKKNEYKNNKHVYTMIVGDGLTYYKILKVLQFFI